MRKRILAMLLCLCMVFCMIPLTASAEEVETPKTYVALGDSIASGYGVEEGEAFPEVLADTCGSVPGRCYRCRSGRNCEGQSH